MMVVVDVDGRAAPRDRSGADPGTVLGRVFREEYGSLVGLARLLLDDRGLAEEVVQEAFVRTYAGWHRLRDPHDPLPYLRRAVVNLARGGLRRRRTARAHLAVVPAVPPPAPQWGETAAEAGALEGERRRAVAAAVRTLPARQRECVVLRYFLDCSTAETASTLGISDGAVKQHLHRALHALADSLEALR